MHQPLDNNMQTEQIQQWTLTSFLVGLFNTLSGWGVNEWVAVLGVVGMLFSLLMQRHYNRRRDLRESEQHEWQRRAVAKQSDQQQDTS